MSKNTIKLTEAELYSMIEEATKQTLNELSPQYIAGAYKTAADQAYASTSPMETMKKKEQAERFRRAARDKYNSNYGVMDDNASHTMQDLYYSPYTKQASVTTWTADRRNNTHQLNHYDSDTPTGQMEHGRSTDGGMWTKNTKLANRAVRGEKAITKALDDLNNSKEPTMESVKLSENDLNRLVVESINDVLAQLNEGAGWDTLKDLSSTFDGTEDLNMKGHWGELKDIVDGTPDQRKYETSKMLRKTANFDKKRANTPEEKAKFANKSKEYAFDELNSQPGLRGKMKRGAVVAGAYGAAAAKKLGNKLRRK